MTPYRVCLATLIAASVAAYGCWLRQYRVHSDEKSIHVVMLRV
jgi:hypothetical protein